MFDKRDPATDFGKLQKLNIATEEVEELLVALILDEKISGQIDQVNQRLELQQRYGNLMICS